ncbi:MAG: TetR/AcrR family transcriptional repressor of uid operon, partial [Bacteroidia bacterium]
VLYGYAMRLSVQAQQNRILGAAKLCFQKRGLAHTTMRDIATEADMSLGNIYRYFKNKKALIQAFTAVDAQEIAAALALLDSTTDFKGSLRAIAKEIIKALSGKAGLLIYIDMLSEALRDDELLALLNINGDEETLARSLEKAEKEHRIRLTLPPSVVALGVIAFIENVSLKCIVNSTFSEQTANRQFKKYIDVLVLDY